MRIGIHLFGPFHVTVNGVRIDDSRWAQRKSRMLVKVLALQPLRQSSRQMHREELIELLWPGIQPEQGRNNLNKALHAARRAIEPGLSAGSTSNFLQLRDQLVTLQGAPDEISVDVAEFEALAEAALKTEERRHIEQALAIYHSDLLPEDLYEDWITIHREQLRSKREQLLWRLAAACEASGDSAQAIETYNQLVASDHCNEAAYRGLMRLYAATGQRHLAVQQFRLAEETLKRELNAAPELATTNLLEQILAGAGGSSAGQAVASIAPGAPASPPPVVTRPKPWWKRWHWAAAITLLGMGALAMYRFRETSAPVQSVAIMPLSVAADAPELEYAADGITESVINLLSQLPQVRIMARSTVYRYRAKGLDPLVAAAEMKVHAILTGTISRHRGLLVLAVELVGVPEGSRLWGSQYELTEKDLISVPDRLSAEIARNLGLRLSKGDRAHLSPSHPSDPEAYKLYAQARFFWNKRSKEGYLKSIELFQAAIARDPAYARAYAGLSDSYSFLGRDEAPTHDYMAKAKEAAYRALALDDRLAEAHASLAMMSNVYDWNFKTAEREFQRALELDPSYATTRLFYGVFLASKGRFEEAQSQLDQAASLDPLSPIIALCRGYPASFSGHIEPAIKAAQDALEISPDFPAALEDLMVYFERQGRREDAMEKAVALLHARSQHELAGAVQAAYRRSGYDAALRTWFQAEEKRATETYVSPSRLGQLAMRAGDMDKAFAWFDKAVAERNAALVYLGVDPKYERLHSDARYAPLCARVGVKPAVK